VRIVREERQRRRLSAEDVAKKDETTESGFADPRPEWGAGEAMSDFEAMMWRAEADPRLRSHGVVLNLLERAPDFERLYAAHEWGVRRVPRLRARVVDDPLHLGPPAWVATDVDLGYHLRRVTLPDGGKFADALGLAEAMAMAPFDPARPLWDALLVEGLADGKAVYILKLHHSLADALGFMQLFDLLFSDRPEHTPDKAAPEEEPPEELDAYELAARRALDGALHAPGWAVRVARSASRRTIEALTAPGDTVAYARSLARVTVSNPAPPSPLLEKRGLARRLGVLDAETERLRAAGRAASGTLNDAYLAALCGGLRRYHEAHGVSVGDLPLALPVSVRKGEDAHGGNRFAGARIAAPVGEPDPAARIELIGARVRAARDEPALDFLAAVAPLMSRAPNRAIAEFTANFTRPLALQASNVPGMRRDAYMAGARIQRMYPFGPVPGSAGMATLFSHQDTCCVGFNLDHTAIPDTDVYMRCMEEGFAEVLALAPGPTGEARPRQAAESDSQEPARR
jgi:diacylglycerol O-acyltransferase / wax synthase